MKILDTNMILRFLIRDDETSAIAVKNLIQNEQIMILPEVIAEVVYVMLKVYKYDRQKIADGISVFLSYKNIHTDHFDVVEKGLEYFGKTSLDFVDCLLCAYHTVSGYEICTFDKKLNNLIKRESD